MSSILGSYEFAKYPNFGNFMKLSLLCYLKGTSSPLPSRLPSFKGKSILLNRNKSIEERQKVIENVEVMVFKTYKHKDTMFNFISMFLIGNATDVEKRNILNALGIPYVKNFNLISTLYLYTIIKKFATISLQGSESRYNKAPKTLQDFFNVYYTSDPLDYLTLKEIYRGLHIYPNYIRNLDDYEIALNTDSSFVKIPLYAEFALNKSEDHVMTLDEREDFYDEEDFPITYMVKNDFYGRYDYITFFASEFDAAIIINEKEETVVFNNPTPEFGPPSFSFEDVERWMTSPLYKELLEKNRPFKEKLEKAVKIAKIGGVISSKDLDRFNTKEKEALKEYLGLLTAFGEVLRFWELKSQWEFSSLTVADRAMKREVYMVSIFSEMEKKKNVSPKLKTYLDKILCVQITWRTNYPTTYKFLDARLTTILQKTLEGNFCLLDASMKCRDTGVALYHLFFNQNKIPNVMIKITNTMKKALIPLRKELKIKDLELSTYLDSTARIGTGHTDPTFRLKTLD